VAGRKLTRVEKQMRKTIAANIQWMLDSHDVTVQHLCTKANVSKSQLFNVLNGSSSPSIDLVSRVARAFGVEPYMLLE